MLWYLLIISRGVPYMKTYISSCPPVVMKLKVLVELPVYVSTGDIALESLK